MADAHKEIEKVPNVNKDWGKDAGRQKSGFFRL